jgi:hypothetical protein
MSKSNAFETALLDLIFFNTAITGIAGADASSPNSTLSVSLHTSDPGEGGNQASNETTYGAYARVTLARTAGAWTRTGSVINPAAIIAFPECTSGTATITHFGIGTNPTAGQAGFLIYKGTISPNLSVSTGVTPRLLTGTNIAED